MCMCMCMRARASACKNCEVPTCDSAEQRVQHTSSVASSPVLVTPSGRPSFPASRSCPAAVNSRPVSRSSSALITAACSGNSSASYMAAMIELSDQWTREKAVSPSYLYAYVSECVHVSM